jgi:uncharacterized protein involved in exopolysaccharide biosynthesis
VLGPALVAAAFVGAGLLLPRTWSATAAFVPELAGDAGQRLGSVAAQLGIAVPAGAALQSPQLYGEVARSRQVLRAVVSARYEVTRPEPFAGPLVDYYRIPAGDSLRRVDLAVRRLGRELTVQASARTGLVRLGIRQRSPELAAAILRRVLEAVEDFNVRVRQTQAGGERRFVEERLAVAREELREAEDALERFLERNREYRSSPRLLFAHERLQRQVALRQGVAATLAAALEQARIDEVRATPVLTVVEPPVLPGLPDPRLLLFRGLAVWALALGAGLIGLAVRHRLAGSGLWRRPWRARPA